MISRFGHRAALACGLLLIAGVFILEMSGSAPRMAGSDRITDPVFAATVPGGGVLCQPVEAPPADTASVKLLVGTYGRPDPRLEVRFVSGAGTDLADGSLPAGGLQGDVTIPLTQRAALSRATTVCLRVGGRSQVAIGGEIGPGGAEVVNGKHQPGAIRLVYLRAGTESWWQLLPTLVTRFGLGKASFFGDWTLPVLALVFLALWAGTVRLLFRELT